MMEQIYLPYSGTGPAPAYRHMAPALGPPQGSKLGTYMNQVTGPAASTTSYQAASVSAPTTSFPANSGPPGPPASTGYQLEQDMSGKIAGLSLDHGMKMIN